MARNHNLDCPRPHSRIVIFQILACIQGTWNASHKCRFVDLPSYSDTVGQVGDSEPTFSESISVDYNATGPFALWEALPLD